MIGRDKLQKLATRINSTPFPAAGGGYFFWSAKTKGDKLLLAGVFIDLWGGLPASGVS